MNCLQLVQMLQAQVGSGKDLPWAGPTTLVGISGQYLELFNWIRMAYRDVQIANEDGWRWRVKQGTLSLTIGQGVYTTAQIQAQIADYEDIEFLHFIDDQRYVLVYDPAIGVADQTFCFYILYQDFRGWKDRNVIPSGKPVYMTRQDNESLQFYATPDKAYTVTLDYRTALDAFPVSGTQPGTNADNYTPLYLPERFHEIIMWKALMYWAKQRQNGAKYAAAKEEYDRIFNKMVTSQLPEMQPYLMEYYG